VYGYKSSGSINIIVSVLHGVSVLVLNQASQHSSVLIGGHINSCAVSERCSVIYDF